LETVSERMVNDLAFGASAYVWSRQIRPFLASRLRRLADIAAFANRLAGRLGQVRLFNGLSSGNTGF
jgi:hypothetical protein